jgi:hypothetical protein
MPMENRVVFPPKSTMADPDHRSSSKIHELLAKIQPTGTNMSENMAPDFR